MPVEMLAPGLWRWVALHPAWKPENDTPTGWKQEVASIAYASPDGALVLIDPLVRDDATWRFLEEARRPIVVLHGNSYHGRSTEEVVARTGARVVAAAAAGLPSGVTAVAIDGLGGSETAYLLPAVRAAVFADAVLGAGAGEVRVASPSWSDDKEGYERTFRAGLRRLLDHDVERVLTSHGPPVLTGGRAALARALAGPAWGA
jgi:glyoxylase-like metal-dependent hydrolase (beta-lactamase superfamily II)